MFRHCSWCGIVMLLFVVALSGCLKNLQKTPSDLSQHREGYFKDGTYHNDVYGFAWNAPAWTAVTPGISLGQRFVFGWNSPLSNVRSRLWMYDWSALFRGRAALPVDASLREAAARVALHQGWAFLESEEVLFNGQSALKATYLRRTEEKGVVYFWMERDAVLLANAFAAAEAFDRGHSEMLDILRRIVFSDILLHTIRYSGETLALIAQWYTGSAANWTKIIEFNENISPTALRLGQVISIPMELVIKSDPFPESFVRPTSQPAKQENKKKEAGKEEMDAKPAMPKNNEDPSGLIMAPPR